MCYRLWINCLFFSTCFHFKLHKEKKNQKKMKLLYLQFKIQPYLSLPHFSINAIDRIPFRFWVVHNLMTILFEKFYFNFINVFVIISLQSANWGKHWNGDEALNWLIESNCYLTITPKMSLLEQNVKICWNEMLWQCDCFIKNWLSFLSEIDYYDICRNASPFLFAMNKSENQSI